jgi:hypothetical protein
MGSCQSLTTATPAFNAENNRVPSSMPTFAAAPAAMDKNKPVPRNVMTLDEYNTLRAKSRATRLAFELSFPGLQAQRKKTLEEIRDIMIATRAADAENARLEAEIAAMMAEDEAEAQKRIQRNIALI